MAIYIGTQKVKPSGISKVYVGTQLVYQVGAVGLDYIVLSGETTSINRNQPFSFGGVVTAYYTDGTFADVTADTTFSGYDMSTAGTYTVTASYTEDGITATATYQLIVNKIWVQVWSGSVSTNQSSAGTAKDIWTNVSLTGTQTLRFTFSMSASPSSGYVAKYYNNTGTSWASLTSSKPGSPFQTNVNLNSANVNGILGAALGTSSSSHKGSYIKWNNANKKFSFAGFTSTTSVGNFSITVTKIERYY